MQIDNKRVVSINFAVEATVKGKEFEVLAKYTFSTGNWDVVYGEGIKPGRAEFGDCVEKYIEKAVVESIKSDTSLQLSLGEYKIVFGKSKRAPYKENKQ